MANRRTAKSINIEKSMLDFIITSKSMTDFTVLEIVKNLKEFKEFKYLKRTVWVIIKNLVELELIKRLEKKRDQADCYIINNMVKLIGRLKRLNHEPMLSSTKIAYKANPKQVILSSTEVGKNIIDYINSLESELAKSKAEVIILKQQINELSMDVLSSQLHIKDLSGVGKVQAGEKMFIFNK